MLLIHSKFVILWLEVGTKIKMKGNGDTISWKNVNFIFGNNKESLGTFCKLLTLRWDFYITVERKNKHVYYKVIKSVTYILMTL